jgi:hypothetical protein
LKKAKLKDPTDIELHDTGLIPALLCLYNRYIGSLGTWVLRDIQLNRAPTRATEGHFDLYK